MTEVADLGARGRIAYRWLGEGAGMPLVLLRPLGGNMLLWGRFAEELAARHRVLAFDPRGIGDSGPLPPGVTTRQLADDTTALLDHLRVPRAHVFGLSLGGMVACWLAIDSPERVGKLVLASTLPRARSVRRRVVSEVLPVLGVLLRRGAEAEVGLVHRVLSPRFRRAHPEALRHIEELVRARPTRRRTLRALALAAARHSAELRLTEIRARTLLLVGAEDPLVGARSQTELLLGIHDARLEVLENCGHDLSLEQPEALARHVLAFLDAGPRQDPAHAVAFLDGG